MWQLATSNLGKRFFKTRRLLLRLEIILSVFFALATWEKVGVPSLRFDGNFTKHSAGLSEVSKCHGCGWPICPTCYEPTSGPKERKNEKCKLEPAENEDIAGTHWGQKGHKNECLLFQEKGVRPSLEDTGQRHWLYPALGVIR